MAERFYLIDGSSYIFRAYYAVAPLTNSEGFPTNALFGFSRMLLKLLREAGTEHIVMVFDAGSKTFRNDLYPEYKANRGACPEDLKKQMPFFRDISRALGLNPLELPGFEADDVIGTLTTRLENAGHEVVIVTGDKDLMQLVSDKVQIWDTMKDRWYDPAGVKEKMGVPPEKIIDLLSIMGDSSDNIPGLSGAGPKTAIRLIEDYGDVENILKSSAEIKENKGIRGRNKISVAVEEQAEIVKLSRELVEIKREAPVKIDTEEIELSSVEDDKLVEHLKRKSVDSIELANLTEKFEFRDMFAGVSAGAAPEPELSPIEYKTVFKEDFSKWVQEFKKQEIFSFDLETTSLDPLKAVVVGIAVCWEDERAWYIPVGHTGVMQAEKQLELKDFLAECQGVFEDEKIKKVGQNLKYDASILKSQGVDIQGLYFDTMLAAYLMDPDARRFKLSILAKEYLGRKSSEYEDVVSDAADFSEVPIDLATDYAGEDAAYAWLLFEKLETRLKEDKLEEVFYTIEMPLVRVIVDMELAGVMIDSEMLGKMSGEFQIKIEILQKQLYELAGQEFNLNSPKQLSEILFGKMEIPTKGLKKTKTGISTNQTVLEKLSHDYELPALILEYRGLAKLKSTYIDALPEQVSAISGRLHSKLNQTGTATGRLSSSEPNLQNIPVQSTDGRKIRQAFIAPEGKVIISADYSQIELRVLAAMSGDENLIAAFKNEEDIHSKTAREILGLGADDELSSEDRRVGKTINFGIVYGMSGFRLGKDLGIPIGVAQSYINEYFDRYPAVGTYFDELEKQAEEKGYVRTSFGRKRLISSIDSRGRDKGFLRRVAVNAPIQGTAADIVKLAMIKLDSMIRYGSLKARMIMQIHDELVFEADESLADELSVVIREEMENIIDVPAPFKVDIGAGKNWLEAH